MRGGLPRVAATRLMEQKTQQRLSCLTLYCLCLVHRQLTDGVAEGRGEDGLPPGRGGEGADPASTWCPGGLGAEEVVRGRTGVPGGSGAQHRWL